MSLAIQCDACGAKFKMPERLWEQRVAGRVATLPCRKCRAPMKLDGTTAHADAASGFKAPVVQPRVDKPARQAPSSGAVTKPKTRSDVTREGSLAGTRPAVTPAIAARPKAVASRVAPPIRAVPAATLTRATPRRSEKVAPAVRPAPAAKPVARAQATRTPANSPVPRPAAPKPVPLAQPDCKEAALPASPPTPAITSHEAPLVLGAVDSVPSLRALSLTTGADESLDDGPTPPPVTRSRHVSEQPAAVESTGSARSLGWRQAVSAMTLTAAVLLGGAFLWRTHGPAGERKLAAPPLRETTAQNLRVANAKAPVEASALQAAAPSPPAPGETVPPTRVGGSPDEQRLGFARSWARSNALACHRGGRAVGDVTLTITFAPSGRVTRVEMQGEPVASAPVGRCVADFYRAMIVPAFEGEPFSLSERLTLR